MSDNTTENSSAGDSRSVDHGLSAKGLRTRQRIVAAARSRFGADTVRSVSISAIANDVGLTPAAVYPYFANKDAVFVAALDDEVSAWVGAGNELTDSERPVVAMFARLVRELDQYPLVERTLRSGSGEHLRQLLDSTAITQLRDTIEQAIVERQAAGTAAADHAASSLAAGVETIVVSLLTTVVRTGLAGNPERLAGVIAIFDAALGPPTKAPDRPA